MTIFDWLARATTLLRKKSVDSARLDAEMILTEVLSFYGQRNGMKHVIPREFLLAHGDKKLPKPVDFHANRWLNLRRKRIPLAYILQRKEFYGRNFYVNPSVLIPRPESEQFFSILHELLPHDSVQKSLLDLGTGSGVLAITAKLELRDLHVFASDISEKSLAVAKQNATMLNAKVEFIQSNLFSDVPPDRTFDFVVANLPYVSKHWDVLRTSPELSAEPALALFAEDDGLELNKKCIQAAGDHLKNGGYLILEADPTQLDALSEFAKNRHFTEFSRHPYHLVLAKSEQSAANKHQ